MRISKKEIPLIIFTLIIVGGAITTAIVGFMNLGVSPESKIPDNHFNVAMAGILISVFGFMAMGIRQDFLKDFNKIKKTYMVLIMAFCLSIIILLLFEITDLGILFIDVGIGTLLILGTIQVNFLVAYCKKKQTIDK